MSAADMISIEADTNTSPTTNYSTILIFLDLILQLQFHINTQNFIINTITRTGSITAMSSTYLNDSWYST